MGWIRFVDRQALHRPHGSLAVHLKYKKNLPDAGFCLRYSIFSDFAGSDRGVGSIHWRGDFTFVVFVLWAGNSKYYRVFSAK